VVLAALAATLSSQRNHPDSALARVVTEAARFIAANALAEEGAPAIVQLITRVASRFSVAVSEKFAAQSVPVIGAAGGAAINLVFINHFQDMARGHFTVRRLERKYGADVIRGEYARQISLLGEAGE
jgi:hypothetical protein